MSPGHVPHPGRPIARRLVTVRFFWLLCGLLLLILVAPSVPAYFSHDGPMPLLFIAVMLGAVHAGRGGRTGYAIAAALSVSLLASAALGDLLGTRVALVGAAGMLLLCLLYSVVCSLLFVLDAGRVSLDHIYGALCAYILIAFAFGLMYTMLHVLTPDSFAGIRTDAHPWAQFIYFSFTTLSTTGYGDIVPVSLRARSFATVEQIVGTFYVAVLIARIAGLYPPPEQSGQP